MKFFNQKDTKKTAKLPMAGKVRTRLPSMWRLFWPHLGAWYHLTAFAANDPIHVVNNLSDFIFGLVRAVGMIMLGFGIVQVG